LAKNPHLTRGADFHGKWQEGLLQFPDHKIGSKWMNHRSEALAAHLEAGATALAAFAATLSETEWQTRVPKDGRRIGVVVHHVASVYPIEIQLARLLAAGQSITDVTSDAIDAMNRDHAKENDSVAKEPTLALLAKNSAAAAAAIRDLKDEELDRAAPVSLYSNAPLTCQFFLEDHAVRHSYHHLARIRATLAR
jgi:DinB superfamily